MSSKFHNGRASVELEVYWASGMSKALQMLQIAMSHRCRLFFSQIIICCFIYVSNHVSNICLIVLVSKKLSPKAAMGSRSHRKGVDPRNLSRLPAWNSKLAKTKWAECLKYMFAMFCANNRLWTIANIRAGSLVSLRSADRPRSAWPYGFAPLGKAASFRSAERPFGLKTIGLNLF